MCLWLSLFLSPTRSPSPFLIPSLYLFLSLPPSLSPLMNHLPLPLNSTESEGSSKVASISPASHSRETWKQQTALPAVHERTHLRVSTLMSVCFYQAQGNTKGRKSLWAQYVICMSYANGCVITWLVRSYPCTGIRKKRCTFVSTCAEYVHSAHKGIINQFTYFWPIKWEQGKKHMAELLALAKHMIIILICIEMINL